MSWSDFLGYLMVDGSDDDIVVEYWNGVQWVNSGRCQNVPVTIRTLFATTARAHPGTTIRAQLDGRTVDLMQG